MSVHQLVAHFLKENNYTQTLESFEREHGSPIDPKQHLDESLVDILRDRGIYKENEKNQNLDEDFSTLTPALQKLSLLLPTWSTPYPKNLAMKCSLPSLLVSAYLHSKSGVLIGGASDNNLYLVGTSNNKVLKITSPFGRVVIKKIIGYDNTIFLVGMNGRIWKVDIKETSDTDTIPIKLEFDPEIYTQAHARLISDASIHKTSTGERYLVTLGWDFKVKVFRIVPDGDKLEEYAETKLLLQGSCFTTGLFKGENYIIVGKLENTVLEVYNLELQLQYKISLNDAQFSTIAFTPRSITYLNGILAVATSHEPYLRLIVVALDGANKTDTGSDNISAIRRNQIVRNISTTVPLDKFLQPIAVFRPNGSGVWVVGDDSILRGIDLQSGSTPVEFDTEHATRIKLIVVGADPESVVTAGTDNGIQLWN